MTKPEPKIAPCPMCGSECECSDSARKCSTLHEVGCECQYSSGWFVTCSDAIRAHNELSSRLPRAKVLMVLGGMLGQWLKTARDASNDAPIYCGAHALNCAMDKIRAMKVGK